MPIKPSKPKFEDQEGSIKLAIFKNKNRNGNVYPIVCITAVRFPVKYCRKLYLKVSEVEKLKKVIDRMPNIEKKVKK